MPGIRRLNPIEVVVALRETVADLLYDQVLFCHLTMSRAQHCPHPGHREGHHPLVEVQRDKSHPKGAGSLPRGSASAAPSASHSGSTDVVMEPAPTQKRERPAVEPEAEKDVEIVSPEPSQEVQRENIPTEEIMCPGCGANLVRGTIVCPARNTNITGTPEVKRGILAKRKELLNKLDYKCLDADTIERIGSQSKQFCEESAFFSTSTDAVWAWCPGHH